MSTSPNDNQFFIFFSFKTNKGVKVHKARIKGSKTTTAVCGVARANVNIIGRSENYKALTGTKCTRCIKEA